MRASRCISKVLACVTMVGVGIVAVFTWRSDGSGSPHAGTMPGSITQDPLREILEGGAPGCDRIAALSIQALHAYEASASQWDELLFALAEAADHARCPLETRGWYVLVASDTHDPILRAAANMHLGDIERAAGRLDSAVTRYGEAMAACDAAQESLLINRVRISVINGLANTLASMNRHAEAADVHRKAIDLAVRTLEKDDPTVHVILLNQARLAERSGDLTQAIEILADRLRQGPRDDPQDFVEMSLRLHRLVAQGQGPHAAHQVLEATWNEHFDVLSRSPSIARLGWELVKARLKIPGESERACDLAACLIHLIGEQESAWIGSASPSEKPRLAGTLREILLSCASTLQSYSLHRNDSYIDLAYATWLDAEPESTQHDLVLAQWAREKSKRPAR